MKPNDFDFISFGTESTSGILERGFEMPDGSADTTKTVEAVLLGFPMKQIIIGLVGGKYSVVAGHESLNALRLFMNGETTLGNMRVIADASGKRFAELPTIHKKIIRQSIFSVYTLRNPPSEEVVQLVREYVK